MKTGMTIPLKDDGCVRTDRTAIFLWLRRCHNRLVSSCNDVGILEQNRAAVLQGFVAGAVHVECL